VAAEAAQRVRDARADAIRAQMVHCDKIIEDLVTVETDRILGYLSEALTTVMDQVADVVEHLDGARTPQQVIDAGVGDAWRELSPLRDEYDQIRTAQEWAMSGDLQLTSPRSKYLLDDPLATDTRSPTSTTSSLHGANPTTLTARSALRHKLIRAHGRKTRLNSWCGLQQAKPNRGCPRRQTSTGSTPNGASELTLNLPQCTPTQSDSDHE
jgi:hypothetical protein